MAWFNVKNASGNFPDLADAVNKLLESEKNLEKNFDTAVTFEEKGEFGNEGSFYLRSVNKLQESEKNIEKSFDTAFGFEEKWESRKEGHFYLRSVNKLQESDKNIEKSFDTAFGFEEKLDSGNEGSFYFMSEKPANNIETDINDSDSKLELERVKREMKMTVLALHGAARQAQRKSIEAEVESLRQRISTLERKVYALTKENDTLLREQGKKNDAAALLKEKDEIINQVMADGNTY